MRQRIFHGRTAARCLFFAIAILAIASVGNGWALQPTPKGKTKDAPKATESNPIIAALQDDLDLLEAQLKLKTTAVEAAERRLKVSEAQFQRMKAIGDKGLSSVELSQFEAAFNSARSDFDLRSGELNEHKVRVRIARRKLDAAIANPPTLGGPTAAEESLAKMVQLLAERNKAEKEWIGKESDRQAKDAERQAKEAENQKAMMAREIEKQKLMAEQQKKEAEARIKESEDRLREEMKRRMDAELERQRQEKLSVLKRLPNEIGDAELRIRAAELKREQTRLELEVTGREIERLKGVKAQLDELRATLEKELKSKNDK